MKVRDILGILAVISVFAVLGMFAGCAMRQTMKTGAGENINTDKLITDEYFKDDYLVKVALERNRNSGFYGLQATYMNDIAYGAFLGGKDFPEGSKIDLVFFSFYEKDGVVFPIEKIWSAGMEKTPTELTENWGYSSVDYATMKSKFPDPVTSCYTGCHKAKKSNDYVFIDHPRK